MKYITASNSKILKPRMSLKFFRFCGSVCLKDAEKHDNIDNSRLLTEQTLNDSKILSKEVTVHVFN